METETIYPVSRGTIVREEPVSLASTQETGATVDDVQSKFDALELPTSESPEVEQSQVTTQPEPTPEIQSDLPDLSELDLPEDLGLSQEEEEARFGTPEAIKLDEDLKKTLGYGLKEIAEGAKQLKLVQEHYARIQAEQYKQQVTTQLQTAWGVQGTDFDARIQAVTERFNKYPKDLQNKLDNPEGIQLIWAKIEQERNAKGNIPQFQKSTGTTTGANKPMFTRREIEGMSEEAYARNQAKILYAYKNGLVKD